MELLKEDLIKLEDFFVELLTHSAPNLWIATTSHPFEQIRSLKMYNNLSWGIVVQNAENQI